MLTLQRLSIQSLETVYVPSTRMEYHNQILANMLMSVEE
jgi:hypothetical protein